MQEKTQLPKDPRLVRLAWWLTTKNTTNGAFVIYWLLAHLSWVAWMVTIPRCV